MKLTARQQQIIDMAVHVIASEGIQNLTMKTVAERLGITEPAIYRHFRGKTDLLLCILNHFSAQAETLLSEIDSKQYRGVDAIECFVRDRFATMAKQPERSRVIFSEEIFQDDPVLADAMLNMMHGHRKQFLGWIAEAQQHGDIRVDLSPDMIARMILGPVRLLVKQWGLSGYAFNIVRTGDELLEGLRLTLAPPCGKKTDQRKQAPHDNASTPRRVKVIRRQISTQT